ncbi:centrosomal protein of 162 kDa-like isoform X2 [Mya arenaria]|uniref:centrosomal protein of 162 kDa-like isoform X2 n=1 Tax=Mya arenaria TaxID=6604 RepID=UPI0022E5EC3D|nr:centrosomal protein of 162 kDa-like isoform X2 [Mya arenaria]
MSRKKKGAYSRDFDDQFEAFLKESLSSEDSINSAHINKYLAPPKKEARPWWDVEDEDNNTSKSKSFLKKSTDKKKGSDAKASPKLKPRKDIKSKVKPEISLSKDSLDDISEKSEEDHHHHNNHGQGDRPRVHLPADSMDSFNTEDLLEEKGHQGKLGMDTLDELADKEKFFRDLENNADGTVDYGRLNQELSATAQTLSPEGAARNAATLAALKDIEDEEEETERPHTQLQSEKEHSEQKPSMLSKVSLMDSLESTMNTTTSPKVGRSTLREATLDETDSQGSRFPAYNSGPDTLKVDTGLIGTNTSQEIEDFRKALERVGASATLGNDSQLELSFHSGGKGTEDLVKKLLKSNSAKQRNLTEIMKELEDFESKSGADRSLSPKSPRGSLERQRNVAMEIEEARGFNLSPANPAHDIDYSNNNRGENSQRGGENSYSSQRGDSSYRGGFDTSHTEDTEMYQPVIEVSEDPAFQARHSVTERGRGKKKVGKDEKKRSGKGKSPKDGRKKGLGSTLDRSRSSSPMKIDYSETLKWKHKAVKSSGYGQPFSPPKPPRDKNRDREKELLGYSRSHGTQEGYKDTSASPAQSPAKVGRAGPSDVEGKKTKKGLSQKLWSPAEIAKNKIIGSQSSRQVKLGTMAATQLDASVESFAKYIKDHFAGMPAPQVKYSEDEPSVSASFKEKEQPEEDKDQVIASLKGELESQARSYERQLEGQKLEYEQQLAELRQENFVLKAKISGEGDGVVKRRVLAGEPLEGLDKDQLEGLQKEVKEQETLIAGYQQENKRLYNEMKNLRQQSKQLEDQMFQENQKLLTEAANLRKIKIDKERLTQLEKKEAEYQNKGLITGPAAQQRLAAGNTGEAVAHLEGELGQARQTCDALSREMGVLQHSRTELEKHVEKLVLEREQLQKTIEQNKTLKSEEAMALERQYQGEVEKLKGKLKWYAENQELLDKGARKVKAREDEIHRLKMRLEELQTESGKRVEDSKVRARERAGDTKKIQDLQRQVKEMEAILKRRNPNSLQSLMMTAAAAGDTNNQANQRTAYTEVLESRVSKLEKELEGKDTETNTLLRGVEQKYHSVKVQYEERIKELEIQLSIYQGQADHVHPHTHSVALERELESVRERYKQQIRDLQTEVDRLIAEASKAKKSDAKAESQTKETEAELRALVKTLQLEVEGKDHDIQVLQKSLDRLRKDRQLAITGDNGKRGKLGARGGNKGDDAAEFTSLPSASELQGKTYDAKVFQDTHISEVIQENDNLKMKVERVQLEVSQCRVDIQRAVAEGEAALRRTQEAYEERLEQQRDSHQQEVKRLLAQNALEHSTSRMAELQSKVDTQEVMIKHLREQQARLEVEAEAASMLRIKQTRLEETLKSLHRDLKEAKKSHTPEMRHFESLQEKIVQIETKHAQREKELQDIILNSRQAASIETEREVDKWRDIVETKNNEIQRFRVELDSILEVLRVLQKQGVVIPVTSTAVS